MPTTEHRGGCHCGAVRYTVDIDLSAPAVTCNCSMCGRTGTMLSFVGQSQFKLEQGDDNLTDYKFGKQKVHHLFCKTCGVKSFARGDGPHGPMVAVNVRCLDDVELDKIPTQFVDGRAS
jgi:hypothetical protein